jgi:hypothetical protein
VAAKAIFPETVAAAAPQKSKMFFFEVLKELQKVRIDRGLPTDGGGGTADVGAGTTGVVLSAETSASSRASIDSDCFCAPSANSLTSSSESMFLMVQCF